MFRVRWFNESSRWYAPAKRAYASISLLLAGFPPFFLINVEMAMYPKVNSLAFKVVFVLLSFCFLCETVIRSKDSCIVCGKKSQNIPLRSSTSYFYDLEACFGFNPITDVNAGDICEGCRRAVQEYRSTGKTFRHVSVACHFLFSRKHFMTVRLT